MKINERKIVGVMGSNILIKEITDPPYTLIGHTTIQPEFSLTLDVKGLREILSFADNDSSLQITITNNSSVEFSIVKNIKS